MTLQGERGTWGKSGGESGREDIFWMAKRFEFQRIAAEITEKHGGLFSRLPDETNAWRNHECNACRFELFCEAFKILPIENGAEMRNGDFDSIDMAMSHLGGHLYGNMSGDLIPEKVEIDPGFGAASFDTTEQVAIETASGVYVFDGKGVMEGFEHDARRVADHFDTCKSDVLVVRICSRLDQSVQMLLSKGSLFHF
jgi:hypothetical protein